MFSIPVLQTIHVSVNGWQHTAKPEEVLLASLVVLVVVVVILSVVRAMGSSKGYAVGHAEGEEKATKKHLADVVKAKRNYEAALASANKEANQKVKNAEKALAEAATLKKTAQETIDNYQNYRRQAEQQVAQYKSAAEELAANQINAAKTFHAEGAQEAEEKLFPVIEMLDQELASANESVLHVKREFAEFDQFHKDTLESAVKTHTEALSAKEEEKINHSQEYFRQGKSEGRDAALQEIARLLHGHDDLVRHLQK